MNTHTVLTEKSGAILTVTLNRPEMRNAFNEDLIARLTEVFSQEARDDSIRVVLLKGAGKVFCAGGDLQWLKKSVTFTREQNYEDARRFLLLLETINDLPKPVVGRIHGAALAGGMGLVACCDYVVASKESLFGFTEVQIGLVPAVIGPFVVTKIGQSHARSLFLSGEKITAGRAYEIGLVHQVVETEADLEGAVSKLTEALLTASPRALRTAKSFLQELKGKALKDQYVLAAHTLADIRVTGEAQEGIRAFLERRKPNW